LLCLKALIAKSDKKKNKGEDKKLSNHFISNFS
jgi:hypothetical protein